MSVREVAAWLANTDSNGCTDEEFAEVFVLMMKMWQTGDNTVDLTEEDMHNADPSEIAIWIERAVDEILFSEETNQSAWWKHLTE